VLYSNILYLHVSVSELFSNTTDFSSRAFCNDFLLNSWYVLWTSFWYIPLFILTLLVIFLYHVLESSNNQTIILVLFFTSLAMQSYQNLNLNIYYLDLSGENFNILLSNSINKFHPALFYGSLMAIVLYKLSGLSKVTLNFSLPHSSKVTTHYTMLTNPLVIFTLSLGSWWALQEGSWGGWWNWDASEVFGLLVMLIYLNSSHRVHAKLFQTLNSTYLHVMWVITALMYVFIQFNFDLVSHNFGTRSDQFIDTSYNFLTLIFGTLVLIHVVYSLGSKQYLTYLLTRGGVQFGVSIKWQVVVYAVTVYIIFLSFNTLLNDFFWKIIQINVLNSTPLVVYFSYMTLAILLIKGYRPHLYLSFVPALSLCSSTGLWLIAWLSLSLTLNSLFHIGVLVLILDTCTEHNHTLSFWEYLHQNVAATFDQYVSDLSNTQLSLNNFFVEVSNVNMINGLVNENTYNILWASSSTENHSFGHTFSSWLFEQVLYSGTNLVPYAIRVVDVSVVSTTAAFITLAIKLRSLIIKKYLIIF